MGRLFIILGILFIIIGLLFLLAPKIPGIRQFGHLPGDLFIKKGNFRFYFPFVTCIMITVVLTLLFQLIHFFKNR